MPIFKSNNRVGFYIHIPKTAGTSVTKILRSMNCTVALDGGNIESILQFSDIVQRNELLNSIHEHSPCNPQHIHKELYNSIIDHSKIDFNFTIIRDPEERILSEYCWINKNYSPSAEYCSGASSYDEKQWVLTDDFSLWLRETKKCYDEDPYVWDNHLRKQTDFILNDTKLFRFDQISEIPGYLNESMGTSHHGIALPHLNKRKTRNEIINISDEDKELIRNWYKDDYELYHSLED